MVEHKCELPRMTLSQLRCRYKVVGKQASRTTTQGSSLFAVMEALLIPEERRTGDMMDASQTRIKMGVVWIEQI